jgi:hypothetical protein
MEFTRQHGILIGQVAVIIGMLYGSILLIMAGAVVLVNEFQDIRKEREDNDDLQ